MAKKTATMTKPSEVAVKKEIPASVVNANKQGASNGAAKAKKEITHQMIAERAYELYLADGGTPEENWYRAEHELRGN